MRPHALGALQTLVARIPDAMPALALLAAVLALVAPVHAAASHIDLLLAGLVLTTALDIEPRALLEVRARWRAVAVLTLIPFLALAAGAWGLSFAFSGATRDGMLALGVSPTEVASVGLVGLAGGPTELALAVLAGSLVVSVIAGPLLLSAFAPSAHHAAGLALLGRFALVVLVPLIAGLCLRAALPSLRRAGSELAAVGSLLVAGLIYGSLAATGAGALGGALLASIVFLAWSGVVAGGVHAGAGRRSPLVAQATSLRLVVGMRDFAVAAALAIGAFGTRAGHVAGVYGVLMLLGGATAVGLTRWRARSREGRAVG